MENREDIAASSDDLESIIAQHWDTTEAAETSTEAAKEETTEEVKTEETTAEAPEETVEAKEETEEEKTAKTESVKAPESWNLSAKEKFAELPDDVRAEIVRRENEMGVKNREAAQYRNQLESIGQSILPYKEYIDQRGGDPMQAMGELLATATQLFRGTQRQKAEAIAGLFTEFGVDVNELDSVLAEAINRPKPSATEQAILEKLNKLERVAAPQPQQQQNPDQIRSEIATFANDPANEFFMHVKEDMGLLMNSGRAKTLKDAYNIAVKMNDEVSKVLSERAKKQAERVKAGNQSLKGKAPNQTSSRPKTGDDALWEAIDSNWE